MASACPASTRAALPSRGLRSYSRPRVARLRPARRAVVITPLWSINSASNPKAAQQPEEHDADAYALTVVSVSKNRKKPEKPPIEKKSVLARLQRACDGQLFVSVRRWIPHSERVDGFVLALGEKWVLLAQLDGVSLHGWCLLRLKDIQAVFIDPDSVATKVLQARDQWPPPAVAVSLDDAAVALSSTTEIAPLISIFVELDRPDIMWLGSVTAIDRDRVLFLEVSTLAEWHRKPRAIDLEDVTRIEFGGSYEEGLALVAGPRPVE